MKSKHAVNVTIFTADVLNGPESPKLNLRCFVTQDKVKERRKRSVRDHFTFRTAPFQHDGALIKQKRQMIG